MADAVKIKLPDPDHAKRMGWKYHVQWSDEGLQCFYRRKSFEQARRDFEKLTAEGCSPFVVDALTGEPVQMRPTPGAPDE